MQLGQGGQCWPKKERCRFLSVEKLLELLCAAVPNIFLDVVEIFIKLSVILLA